jgi:hypothetical protein
MAKKYIDRSAPPLSDVLVQESKTGDWGRAQMPS